MAASGRASSLASPEELDLLRGIERLTRATIPRGEVPRGSPAFQAELERAAAAQADPGAGVRPAGMNRNRRRAAAHHARRAAGDASTSASANTAKPRLVGSWGPKRRR
jgi:ATP-dependent RNA helicase RhlE